MAGSGATAFDELSLGRDEWLAFRRSHVGGSDAAAVMGISPWVTPYQVWAEKSGVTEPEDISDRPRVEWGTRLEREVAAKFADCHPDLALETPGDVMRTLVPRDRPWCMATLDGVVTGPDGSPAVFEAKTAHRPPREEDRRPGKWWGPEGTGASGVPSHYLAQVNHYLGVTGWDRAHVAVLIDGWDYREYMVERDKEDVDEVVGAVDTFWHDRVEAGDPPAVGRPDGPALLSAHPEAGPDYLEGDASALAEVYEWKRFDDLAKANAKDAKEYEARVKGRIGDARGIRFPEGTVTWHRSRSRRFDQSAFRKAHPDLYEEFCKPCVRQQLRWRVSR